MPLAASFRGNRMSGVGWGPAAPILRVRDLGSSLDHYVKALGFHVDWRTPTIASVSRDRCCVFLCAGDQSAPRAWLWLGVPDVRALHEELRAKGAIVRHEPTNFEWALEMQIADPDGNVLRMGSEPDGDARSSEFLDASGRLWKRTGSGESPRSEAPPPG